MIDTIKIFCGISEEVYNIINSQGDCKCSYNKTTGQLYYDITTSNLLGSFDGRLSIRTCPGSMYNIFGNVLVVEGSFHKFSKGQNAYDGYYNLQKIVLSIKKYLEDYFNVVLPGLRHWFLQRIDIAVCFDLCNNDNVKKYINNLSKCNYPRRNLKFYEDESIYISGTSTTLKIYNKLREFKKNDLNNLKNTSFDFFSHIIKIDGFVRFECEIKKRKLVDLYDKKFIRVSYVNYYDLEKIWESEFMKLLGMVKNDIKKIRDKEDAYTRLINVYGNRKGKNLYLFYMTLLCEGKKFLKNSYCSSSYYTNLKLLREAGVDYSQTYKIDIENSDIIDIDIFTFERVA